MNISARDPLPQREGPGKRNLDLFLLGSKAHPICFYFEDEGSEELYLRFLKKIFPRVLSPLVICVGGKTKKQVLTDADQHKLSPIAFVQDKDFDDLIGSISKDPRIVMLNRYSFENYLLEPEALIEIVLESKRHLSRRDAEDRLNFDQYLPDLYDSYRPLCSLFVVSQELNLKGIKTTKQPITDITAKGSTVIDPAVVATFRSGILKNALTNQKVATEDDFDSKVNSALIPKSDYATIADSHPNSHLCGKHLLQLALVYVDSVLGTHLAEIDRFEITMRLTPYVPIDAFDRVRKKIVDVVSAQNPPAAVLELLV